MTELAEKTVYSYSSQTGEYAGETTAMRSPLDEAEVYLIPAWAADAAPPAAGKREAAVFRADDGSVPSHCLNGGRWQTVPDWRATPLWSKTTAQPVTAQLGDTPDSLAATELEPPPFGVWKGKGWVVDKAAQLAAQTAAAEADIAARRAQADAAIVPLQDAVDLAMATPAEAELLAAWRRYRVALSRLPQRAGWPQLAASDWPPQPA